MSEAIDVRTIGPVALGVLVTLLAMSVASIGIMLDRAWSFRLSRQQSLWCGAEMARLLRQGKLAEAAAAAERARRSHVARVLSAGLQEWQYQAGVGEDRDRFSTLTRWAAGCTTCSQPDRIARCS